MSDPPETSFSEQFDAEFAKDLVKILEFYLSKGTSNPRLVALAAFQICITFDLRPPPRVMAGVESLALKGLPARDLRTFRADWSDSMVAVTRGSVQDQTGMRGEDVYDRIKSSLREDALRMSRFGRPPVYVRAA